MFDIIVTIQACCNLFREISSERPRVTLLYQMSVNQRLIANMLSCLFHSKFIRNLAENNGKKTDQ